MTSYLDLALAVDTEAATSTQYAYDIYDINDPRPPAADEFADLRHRLASGELQGYGTVLLDGGRGVVFNMEGYARRRLMDLDDPRLAPAAAGWLQRLRDALRSTTAPGPRYDGGGTKSASAHRASAAPTDQTRPNRPNPSQPTRSGR